VVASADFWQARPPKWQPQHQPHHRCCAAADAAFYFPKSRQGPGNQAQWDFHVGQPKTISNMVTLVFSRFVYQLATKPIFDPVPFCELVRIWSSFLSIIFCSKYLQSNFEVPGPCGSLSLGLIPTVQGPCHEEQFHQSYFKKYFAPLPSTFVCSCYCIHNCTVGS
jgi:hypothetical protein